MINLINDRLTEKLKNREPLTDEDIQLLYENMDFLNCLLTWIHWEDYKETFEGEHYEAVIEKDSEMFDAIVEFCEKREID